MPYLSSMPAKRKQHPHPQTSFWRSPSGIATGAVIGVAGIGTVLAMTKKPSSPPPPSNGEATYTNFQVGNYLMNVLSPLDSTTLLAALNAVGFANILVQPDPYQAGDWLVSATWTGYANAQPTSNAPSTTLVDGGPGAWQINPAVTPDFLGTTTPPVPQPYSGMTQGTWYTFSISTAFLQTAKDSNGLVTAPLEIQKLLQATGWGAVLVTAVAGDPANNTWNVAAQWGSPGTVTQDAPPLWIYLPTAPPMAVGTTQPAQPSSVMP